MRDMTALASMENRPVPISSGVPAFLAKLWKLVEDPQSNHLISWSPDETSFIVHDQVTFSRDILPKYFKHNNFASFVRQLNMYGFRKVVGAEQGGLKAEKDDWQFQNSNFLRRHPHLLENVKRKSAPDDKKPKGEEYTRVLTDIHQLKDKQDHMSTKLESVKRENQGLYQELVELRQKHEEQEHVVNKLIRFLMKLLYSNNGLGGNKRPLMIQGAPETSSNKRQRTQPLNMDNPGPSQTQQESYRSPPRPTSMNVLPNYSDTSGPEITAVDDDEFPTMSISAVRPIINEPGNPPSSDDSYTALRHLPMGHPQSAQRRHYDTYQPSASHMQPQPRIIQPPTSYPVSTMGMMPTRNTPTNVSSSPPTVDREQLQHHVKYIEDNLDSFQSILSGGGYGDNGMLDDFLDSIVDGGGDSPSAGQNSTDAAREGYSRGNTSPTHQSPSARHGPPPSYNQQQAQMGKSINWSVTSMLPEQDRSTSRRY